MALALLGIKARDHVGEHIASHRENEIPQIGNGWLEQYRGTEGDIGLDGCRLPEHGSEVGHRMVKLHIKRTNE